MKKHYDVIVVGGGIAGVSAALSLARSNVSVLLVEKQCILGGLATSGLINWYEPLCNGKGTQLIYGISEELLKLAAEYNATLDSNWINTGKGENRYATFFNHNIFAVALTCLLVKNNVDITFDTLFTDVVIENQKIKAVKLHTIEQEEEISCSYVIDATGSAKVFETCKLPLRNGENYLSFYIHRAGKPNDDLYLRVWDIYGANMSGHNHPQGFPLLSGATNQDINDYIIKSHKVFYDAIKKDNRGLDVTSIPHMPQFRMIRSIIGERTLTTNDKNKDIFDSVGVFGYFLEPGNYFEIPYGSLYNKSIKNLYAAGRIISAIDQGWDAIRVIPVASLSGEIVATAITLLKENNLTNNELGIVKLQDKLIEKNIKIHI